MFKKLLPLIASAAFFIPAPSSAAPITLNAHEASVRSTIFLIAKAGGLNVSVDGSIKGNISITLNDVDPIKALEIIAKTRNLKLVNEDGIFVFTSEHYTSIMKPYIFPIRYGDAETLKKAVIMSLDDNKKPDSNDSNDRNSDEYSSKSSNEYASMTRTRYKTNPDGSIDVLTNRYSDSTYHNNSDGSNDDDSRENTRSKRVYIDTETNSIVLFGTPTEYERVKNLLETLDVELKQVSVEAKILAIDKEATKNLGVEWMWSTVPQYPEHDRDSYTRTNSDGVVTHYEENSYTRKSNETTGFGIIRFGRSHEGYPFEWYYGAKINALVTDGKAKILSRPNVTTIQGREAVINVGSSVPVPTVQTTNSTVTNSIDYRPLIIATPELF